MFAENYEAGSGTQTWLALASTRCKMESQERNTQCLNTFAETLVQKTKNNTVYGNSELEFLNSDSSVASIIPI